jgi:hypothetical protein
MKKKKKKKRFIKDMLNKQEEEEEKELCGTKRTLEKVCPIIPIPKYLGRFNTNYIICREIYGFFLGGRGGGGIKKKIILNNLE